MGSGVTDRAARIVLASGSEIRARLLRAAGLDIDVRPARVDEAAVKAALLADGAPPRDIADALAELKARKIAGAAGPEAYVIGCDQTLALQGALLDKPASPEELLAQLTSLNGQHHSLHAAAVVYHDGQPLWRHVGDVQITFRTASRAYLANYAARNWASVRHSVGGYKLEEEGVNLIQAVRGDYFHVLGLPLIELLSFLRLRGVLPQ